MADTDKVWVTTYSSDGDSLDMGRRQNDYVKITPTKPEFDEKEISAWSFDVVTDDEDGSFNEPSGSAGDQDLDFEPDGDGYAAEIEPQQEELEVEIELPIGPPETAEIIPIVFTHQSLKIGAASVGVPVVFTYDNTNLKVLDSEGEEIRDYDIQVKTDYTAFSDWEPIKKAPNNNVFVLTSEEKIYRITGKLSELIGSFEKIYGFGFDSDSNLYVFDEFSGSENACRRYKFSSASYSSSTDCTILVNGYADPGAPASMNGCYQVASDGGFYFGSSENPDPENRGVNNMGSVATHNSNGDRVRNVIFPPLETGDWVSVHEVVTGIGEDADGNIYCATSIKAEQGIDASGTIYVGSSGWYYDNSGEATSDATSLIVEVSGSCDHVRVENLTEGAVLKISKIEYSTNGGVSWTELTTDYSASGNASWEGSFWLFDPEIEPWGGLDSSSEPHWVESGDWRFTYIFTESGEGGGGNPPSYYTRIYKVSPMGGILWSKLYEGNLYSEGSTDTTKRNISVEPSGFFVAQITGSSLIAFSPSGDELWEIDYGVGPPGERDGDRFKALIIGDDGYVYLLYNTLFLWSETGYYTYYKTIKINASGEIIWTNTSSRIYT